MSIEDAAQFVMFYDHSVRNNDIVLYCHNNPNHHIQPTRIYPSINKLADHLQANSSIKYAMTDPADVLKRYDEPSASNIADRLEMMFPTKHLTKYADLPPADRLWAMFLDTGDYLSISTARSGVKDKEQYHFHFKEIAAFDRSLPKQALIILDSIVKDGETYWLESALEKHITHLVGTGQLKTRQDPWRIFQFYRPSFIDLGLLTRGSQPRDEQ